ncbi:MAG: ATP-binding protein [Victivallales bacterium]|nr:ATP-binding protein [Verrucomicrobiota bacterium]MBT7161406.1 ATP-binding protein [Victivallales bacterium]MBT7299263.1 ATP-binding protein [Victivallales bacterium]
MAFVAGPRQVGKTTTCRALADAYLNWDASADRRIIVAGAEAASQACGLNQLTPERPVLVFDELHKYPHWKKFLKGFFDIHEADCHIVVTGSSRLDVYRRGGDSLMGRYFLYRMHPFSVAELNTTDMPEAGLIREPMPIDDEAWEALLRFGGFPEPMLSASDRFSKRWQRLRHAQLFKEDVRDLTRIQDVASVEIMGLLLAERSGQQLTVANLAQDVGVAPNTAKAWVEALCALHVGFLVRPWFRNISSALRKEPKWFLRDWSIIEDVGQRAETIIACHLLKAVEGWTDLGFGTFDLRYLRDKRKREVDFLVVRDGEPWFLVEVKAGDTSPSPHLAHYQRQTGAAHAFQVVLNLPYVDADCFARTTPTVVPARTFLSQLL